MLKFASLALAACVALVAGASCGGSPTPHSSPGERAALIALYRATDGPNWHDNSKWLTDAPVGDWHGVGVDSSGQVVDLDLSVNSLSGRIPPEIGNLANLTHLDFGGNQLSGRIPSELGSLSALVWMSLSRNQLSGPIPPELGNLSVLTQLRLGHNDLSGEIPPELGSLSDMEWMRLDDNWLSGPIPSELGNLSKMNQLFLSDNQLSGEIPPELGSPPLSWLSIDGNQLTGCVPDILRDVEINDLDLTALPYCDGHGQGRISVRIVENRVALLAAFFNSTNGPGWTNKRKWLTNAPVSEWHGITTDRAGRIVRLELHDNNLKGEIPPQLGSLSNLVYLDLSVNDLGGRIPAQLGNLSNLERLDLSGNDLNGPMPPELGNLSNLLRLDLSFNELAGCIPYGLRNAMGNPSSETGLPFCGP